MGYKINKRSRYNNIFIVVLAIVLLCSCLFVGTVLAWLTRVYVFTDYNNTAGSVHMTLYANGVEVTGYETEIDGVTTWTTTQPYAISGTTATRNNIDLKLRNTGTIDALVRATISLYYLDDNNNHVNLLISSSPTIKGQVTLDYTNWITQFFSPTVTCGYMYYNSKLAPYVLRENNGIAITHTNKPANEITILNSILLSSAQSSETIYLSVTVDAVAYDGNIYKKVENNETTSADIPVEAYPFGLKNTLPASWTAWR